MTKKHFIALANLIRSKREVFTPEVIGELAVFCKDMNPNFKTMRWVEYINGTCGPNGGAVKKPS